MVFRGDYLKAITLLLINFGDYKFEVRNKVFAFCDQNIHSYLIKNIKACAAGGHAKNRSVAQLPAFGCLHRDERAVHQEARFFIMSPPTCKQWKVGILK